MNHSKADKNESTNNYDAYVSLLKKRNLPIIYNLRHLRKYFGIKKNKQNLYFGPDKYKLYDTFPLIKKSGGVRIIDAPVIELKLIQRWIKDNILDKIKISNCAFGFARDRSIYDNAKPHVGNEIVICIDIKDFFPSISYNMVFRIFKYIGYTTQVSHLLTKLCTNSKNVLPQGSPTSPALSNIVLLKLDKRLSTLARKYNFFYTRYADDLTFSGSVDLLKFVNTIKRIINDEGFTINNKKLRYQFKNSQQVVTGLIVNNRVSVRKKYLNELDLALYYIKKYGLVNHMEYIQNYKSSYKEHLYGVAYFINQIDKKLGNYYLAKLNDIDWFPL